MCGIPSVTLEGADDDWAKLYDKTEELGKVYDVTWWTDKLLHIMERIARNAAGADDRQLWQNIYKVKDGSGGPYISGWIRRFFPYIVTRDFSRGLLIGVMVPLESLVLWMPTFQDNCILAKYKRRAPRRTDRGRITPRPLLHHSAARSAQQGLWAPKFVAGLGEQGRSLLPPNQPGPRQEGNPPRC